MAFKMAPLSGTLEEIKVKPPKRFRCSPVPNTAEAIEALFIPSQNTKKDGTRPKSTTSKLCEYTEQLRPFTTTGIRINGHRFGRTRPHTCALRSDKIVRTQRKTRPHTCAIGDPSITTIDDDTLKKASLFVRKRIQEIREARRLTSEFGKGKEKDKTKQTEKSKDSKPRKVSFFKRAVYKTFIMRPSDPCDDSEDGRRRREQKLKLRHKRMTKLIWWFRVLRAICGLALDMKHLSMAITENSIMSEVYTYNACGYSGFLGTDQALFFDKSQFSRRKTMLFPVWAQKLALLSPEKRSESDVRQIRGLMLMMKSFREKFKEVIQYKMAKVAMYINCEKDRIILRQGHWGLNFYFIYSGSVIVQKEIEDPVTKEKKSQTENILRAGESFGEIAILGDGKRTASIICREPTEVFQVDKETFIDTCWEIFESELEGKIQFAKNFEIFNGWQEENFRRLCFMSHSMYIPLGKIIEEDWSKTIYSYFLIQGRISLVREFDISGLSDVEDVKLTGMMDKPLYLPDPVQDKYGGERSVRYANVGELHAGDHSDLRALLYDKDIPMDTLSMISQGVKLLRVENRLIKWLGPMPEIEDYLRKRYEAFRVPVDQTLCQRYVEETNWDDFKQKTVRQVNSVGGRIDTAMVPATTKGTSGWSRWPGSGRYRSTGTTFNSPRDQNEQLAEFVTGHHTDPPAEPVRRTLVRQDTIGLPVEKRRTSLFPRSRIHKQILRNVNNEVIENDRSLMLIPTRPNLTKQRLLCLSSRLAF